MVLKYQKLGIVRRSFYIALLGFGLILCLEHPVQVEAALGQKRVTSQKKEQELKIPENLTPGEVDAYLATLDDRQVRQVLAKKLKQELAKIVRPTGMVKKPPPRSSIRFLS